MVMIGTDSHKRTHTVVALDEVGRRLGTKTVRTNAEGHLALVEWATQFADHDEHGVRFALEDCRHLTRRLESDLLAAGQRVLGCRLGSWPVLAAAAAMTCRTC